MITKPLAKLTGITTGLAALGTAASILLGTMRDTDITLSMNYAENTTGPIMETDGNTNITTESDQYFLASRTFRLQYLIAEIAAGHITLGEILPWQPDRASVLLSGSEVYVITFQAENSYSISQAIPLSPNDPMDTNIYSLGMTLSTDLTPSQILKYFADIKLSTIES